MNSAVKVKIKNLTLLIGGIGIIALGLFFVLFTDLYLKNTSPTLFISIVLSIGCGVFFLLGERFKHNPKAFYAFKGVGAALGSGYIAFLFIFKALGASGKTVYGAKASFKCFKRLFDETGEIENSKVIFMFNRRFIREGADIEFSYTGLYVIMIVLAFLFVALECANIVSNAIFKIEE